MLFLGFSDTSWAGIPLPFELAPLGASGCFLLTSIDDVQPVATNAQGAASFSYALPNNIYLLGERFYNQYLVADPMVNGLGVVLSNGGVGMFGNQ
jgi:hypothetical protein